MTTRSTKGQSVVLQQRHEDNVCMNLHSAINKQTDPFPHTSQQMRLTPVTMVTVHNKDGDSCCLKNAQQTYKLKMND